MIKTQYVCDKCKTEVQRDDLWTMNICVEHGPQSYISSYASITVQRQKHWCRTCVEGVGLLPKVLAPKNEVVTEPTFEELIRRICREELEAQS